jgi:hypothetical protein
MGYTHYWYTDLTIVTPERFAALGKDAARLFDVAATEGIVVVREYDRPGTRPEIGELTIRFNGLSDDGGHETFSFDARPNVRPEGAEPTKDFWADDLTDEERRIGGAWWRYNKVVEAGNVRWTFCKTSRKPYDAVVCALLMRAKVVLGAGIRVTSDGYFDSDWGPGRDLYLIAYGEDGPSPIEPDEE